jgi:putative endopeptidase
MRILSSIALTAVLAACASKAVEEKKPVTAAAPVAPTAAASPTPKAAIGDFGLDLAAGNPSVKPGDDFFAYANGTWDKNFAIPADKASYGPFDKLDDLSKVRVRAIIEKAAAARA